MTEMCAMPTSANRHCEARSAVAIHDCQTAWIATLRSQ